MQNQIQSQIDALAEKRERVRREIALRRDQAFIRWEPTVCGVRICRPTMETHGRLKAFECAFVAGGLVDAEAIAVFVWCHHAEFGQDAHAARKRVMAQVSRYLFPRWDTLRAHVRMWALLPRLAWLRRFHGQISAERHAEATQAILGLLSDAWGDMPAAGRSHESGPVPPALEAIVSNTFAQSLGLSFAETARMPLAEVVQRWRHLISQHEKPGSLSLWTAEEQEIEEEELRLLEQIDRKRSATATQTPAR